MSTGYGFVYQSKGFIKVQSAEDEGTTLVVCFSSSTAGGELAEEVDVRHYGDLSKASGQAIPVVEANNGIREVVATALEKMGYTAHAVASGKAALCWLAGDQNSPALLLSDIVLPGDMGGFDIVRHFQQNLPGCRIVLMSGYAENPVKEFARFNPRPSLLNKPFSAVALSQMVALELGYTVQSVEDNEYPVSCWCYPNLHFIF